MPKIPIDADILPPSNDHIFKTILTHPNAEPVRMDVVSAAINRPAFVAAIGGREVLRFGADVSGNVQRLHGFAGQT